MCSAQSFERADLTAKAVIRDEALRLFAAHGPEAVSMRQIAAAAGVSPSLVIHHYGSRDGLRHAVDSHVAAVFDRLLTQIGTADLATAASGSFTEAIVAALPPDSAIPGYLRRLLISGDPAGRVLFDRWMVTGQTVLAHLDSAGITRPAADPLARAAFLMVNDLAMLLLRDHLTALLGQDPLTHDGMARWLQTALSVYRDGLFLTEDP